MTIDLRDTPRISVIMPCHDCGPWIAEALQSIAAQSYPVHEIIVIDDASTDDSLSVIKASGVDVQILHARLGNAAAARNMGIHAATGDWIAFLDADDAWYSDHLKSAVMALSNTNDIAYLSHYDNLFESDGAPGARPSLPINDIRSNISHEEFFGWYVGPNPGWPTSSMLINRDRLLSVGLFDVEQVRRHDADMFARVVYGHTWTYNPSATWFYRIRSGSISRNESECAYYLLRSQIKLQALWRNPEMEMCIRNQARKAISYAAIADNKAHFNRVKSMAWPYLGYGHRLFYLTNSICPSVVRFVLRSKASLRKWSSSRLLYKCRHEYKNTFCSDS